MSSGYIEKTNDEVLEAAITLLHELGFDELSDDLEVLRQRVATLEEQVMLAAGGDPEDW